jgi:hypothetical protein
MLRAPTSEVKRLSEMSHAEGVRLQEDTLIRKIRRIPTQGQLLVSKGDNVSPETIVVRGTVLNLEIREVKVYDQLGVDATDVEKYMLKREGDEVKKDEAIAIHRSFFNRFTTVSRSPIDGNIETISKSLGTVLIRGKPILVEVKAHIPGRVVDIIPSEGAVVQCRASLIEGTFGIGGETVGELFIAVDKPDEALTTELIKDEHKGKIIVGGSFVTLDALREAARIGANGIIIGAVDQRDLTDFLGYEIGTGITGKEKAGLTLIITEGFGIQPMDEKAFRLLKSHEAKQASIDGSTQIRTRMLRPEILLPS